ncbi:hypothetical protein EST62_09765 [Chlorobaculum sp. 24CR]|jgi:hypothetical protein|uniref:hypothetical protein n=1 Tax=Chlorobaculum sp. 24CR TaxID=2508878 RepID=UPI00100B7653|nr:hypothetical protein [Chlorobaculum sp. 24CR]RXK84331.1 hypothetical protein EST62_09765 [Chlorobaculum sp. 24CR]
MDKISMNRNPVVSAATAVGVVGGGALLAPIAAPVAVPALHGIAGIAIVGLGVYATGAAVFNATRFFSEKATGILNDGAMAVELFKGSFLSSPRPKVPAKEVPFMRK